MNKYVYGCKTANATDGMTAWRPANELLTIV